ncbi:MAG: DUF6485 family protein [Candidatus Thermoplasmatota archaeon]|nr:DUF6485 family protein [Candidatus Thermoplasmatota archaeon]
MKCTSEENKKQFCNCTYSCEKKGRCCDCLHYHRQMGQLPACFFPKDIEKTYDRSIERFIKTYQERGVQ